MNKARAIVLATAIVVALFALFIPGITAAQMGVLLLCIAVAAVMEIRLLERKKIGRKNL